MSNDDDDWEDWFTRVWHHREEILYPSLFGPTERGIFTIQMEMVTDIFQQESVDPRWLHHGVFEFAPTPSRDSWLYVTSGMSNAWESDTPDPTGISGLGCEFVFETTEQAEWPILRLLHVMIFQILLCHGRYPGREPLDDFDRLPLRGSISPEPSILSYLMLAPPSGFPREAHLESGRFDFYQVVGISEAEVTYARSQGGDALLPLLVANRCFPVTNPSREEIILPSIQD